MKPKRTLTAATLVGLLIAFGTLCWATTDQYSWYGHDDTADVPTRIVMPTSCASPYNALQWGPGFQCGTIATPTATATSTSI
jgi:hypothetical protein